MRFDDNLKKTVKIDLSTGTVPALMGEPGIGKSSFFKALATELGTKVFVLACNNLADKADLTAPRLVPNEKGSLSQEFYPHQTIQEAIEYARENPRENPILVMDEINRTNSDITSSTLTLVTERRIGREDLPTNLRIAVAGNDRGNIIALDTASISRFSIYSVEPEAQTFMALMGDKLNPWIKSVLVKHPNYIFQKPEAVTFMADGDDDDPNGAPTATVEDMLGSGDEMKQITTPRTLEYLNDWLNLVDEQDIRMWASMPSQPPLDPNAPTREGLTVLQELIEAKVGTTVFATVLNALIVEDIMNQQTISTGSNGVSVPRVAAYDQLLTLGTQSELDDLVGTFNLREKSASLVYALHDSRPNERIISTLAAAIGDDSLESDQSRLLMTLLTETPVRLDGQNIEALLGSGAAFVDRDLRAMFSMVGIG